MDVDTVTQAKQNQHTVNMTSGVDDAGMEALSPELKRFAAEAEEHIRRRPTSPRGHAGKPLPHPPRRTAALADGKVEASDPSVGAQTVDTQVSEGEPERTDMVGSGSRLNTTRKGSGTQRAKKVEIAEEMKPTAKQISMSWNPSQARRELSAAEKADQASVEPAGRGVIAEIAQERPRSPHVHVAAIRQRLKMSAVSSSSSSDDSESDDDSDRKAPSHLVRSAPAAPSTTTSSSSDSEEERRPTSRSLKSSIRDRFRSDSDSDSSDEDDSSGEEKKEDDAEDSEVVKKRTMTYLTPEQMVKLVRQQRAQQRKELLSKKKKQKAKDTLKMTRKRRDSESDSSESDSDEDSSSNTSEDDEDAPTFPSKPSPSGPYSRSAPLVSSPPYRADVSGCIPMWLILRKRTRFLRRAPSLPPHHRRARMRMTTSRCRSSSRAIWAISKGLWPRRSRAEPKRAQVDRATCMTLRPSPRMPISTSNASSDIITCTRGPIPQTSTHPLTIVR